MLKYGREALREARAAREAGRAPRGWSARAAAWATRRLEAGRRDGDDDDDDDARRAFDSRADDAWRETEDWDAGASEDADASGDATTTTRDARSTARDANDAESDGAGVGTRVLYPETFDAATAAARREAGDVRERRVERRRRAMARRRVRAKFADVSRFSAETGADEP